jgi:hypothetical protein
VGVQKYMQGRIKERIKERMMMVMMMREMEMEMEMEREMERIDVMDVADRVGYVAEKLECDVQLVFPLPLQHVPNCIDTRHRPENV